MPFPALGLLGRRLFGRWERTRARALLRMRIEEPSPRRPLRQGSFCRLRTALRDPVG